MDENLGLHRRLILGAAGVFAYLRQSLPELFFQELRQRAGSYYSAEQPPRSISKDLRKQHREPNRLLDSRIAKTTVRLLVVGLPLTLHIYRGSSLRSRCPSF
ncbi:MAG: hypothetical protein ABIS29_02395, partial [Vicinamibacterales bacterium]